MNALNAPPARPAKQVWNRLLMGIGGVLYLSVIAWLAGTLPFSAMKSARDFSAQLASQRSPPRPLPAMPSFELPQLAIDKDPFAPLDPALLQIRARTQPTSSQQFEFVARYIDVAQRHVLARDADNRLAQFSVGDAVNGGVIRRIDAHAVVLESAGHQTSIAIVRHDGPYAQ